MKIKGSNVSVEEGGGFHVICGTSPENGVNGTIPGIRGCGEGRVLDLSGLNSLLVADLDYFVKHHEGILEIVKTMVGKRDYFKEHPKELKKEMEEARKND